MSKWRHYNDIIINKISTYVKNKITYKRYIFDFFFIFEKLTEWRRFVTYLWNDPLT